MENICLMYLRREKVPFNFEKLEIPEVILIKPKTFNDDRGFFVETYKETEFIEEGIKTRFVQDNHSKTVGKHTIRGFHFQKEPEAQAKLVKVIKGKILDVVIDIREGSKTFGKSVCVVIGSEKKEMIYIPKGFAHGFCTLEEDTEVIYRCSCNYSPENESGIIWNDPDIQVEWPTKEPILSLKDTQWGTLKEIQEENK